MIIYKITNELNDKCYIGQTTGTLADRWGRHKTDALNNILDTHFARAIRKYGPDVWDVTIIDNAETEQELNEKEHYWIHYYNALEDGYNETDSICRSGGNTYRVKTEEEMKVIKEKIRQSKMGGKNPQSKKVKCRNEETGEVLHFDSMAEVRDYFNQSNHQFVSRRCLGDINSLWKGIWNFAYEENEFRPLTKKRREHRATPVRVLNLETQEEKEFPSYAAAERYFGLKPKAFSGKAYKYTRNGEKEFVALKQYHITILN